MTKQIIIKHVMDEIERKCTIDEVFLEALSLSESRTNDIEIQEDDLFHFLKKYPDFINNINDEYKTNVIKSWDYEIWE